MFKNKLEMKYDDDDYDSRSPSNRDIKKEDTYDELSMKRRLTIADEEISYDDEEGDDYEDEYDDDDDEEVEGDEIEYDDDEEYEEKIEVAPKIKTFEEFEIVYKPKAPTQDIIKTEPEKVSVTLGGSSKRFEPPVPAAELAKAELLKKTSAPVSTQNLTPQQDLFKKDISPVTFTSPKQPSPTPQKQTFTKQEKQPSPTPAKQASPVPVKQPSPIPPKQPSPVPSKSIETISTTSKQIPDTLSKPTSVFSAYHPNDEDDDEEYAEEEEEDYSGDEEQEEDDDAEEEEDISDIDDSDLLKRLDEKYGKLPNTPLVVGDQDTHADSDVDNDERDKSWTSN